jgi:hypothetical protein
METTRRFRPVGMTAFERFSVPSTCGCCGREGLKKTVKMTDGSTTIWMGTGCAQNAMDIDSDNFRAHQRLAQKSWDNGGAYRAYLDALLPEFVGQHEKQLLLADRLNGFHAWRETGTFEAWIPARARAQLAIVGSIVLGHDIDGNVVSNPFTADEMEVVRAWHQRLRAAVRAV